MLVSRMEVASLFHAPSLSSRLGRRGLCKAEGLRQGLHWCLALRPKPKAQARTSYKKTHMRSKTSEISRAQRCGVSNHRHATNTITIAIIIAIAIAFAITITSSIIIVTTTSTITRFRPLAMLCRSRSLGEKERRCRCKVKQIELFALSRFGL